MGPSSSFEGRAGNEKAGNLAKKTIMESNDINNKLSKLKDKSTVWTGTNP